MTVPHLPIDGHDRDRIRQRAASIRRRRRRLATAGIAAALAVVGIVAGVVITSGAGRPHQLVVGQTCAAAIPPVPVREDESASFTEIPRGWVTSGNPAHLAYGGLELTPPGVAAGSGGPTIDLAEIPTPSIPAGSIPAPASRGVSTTPVSVGTAAGVETSVAFPGEATNVSIRWSPAPGVRLALAGSAVPATELLAVADGVRYRPGTIVTLPTSVTAKVSAAQAEHALPTARRHRASAALSSWAEIEHVRTPRTPAAPGVDDRPAWLVHASEGAAITWAVVDATTGKVLERATTGPAGWVGAVTDRSQTGCYPPLGLLTRGEMADIAFDGSLAPAGTRLLLMTTTELFQSLGQPQMSLPCTNPCNPLQWVQVSSTQLQSYDAILGNVRVSGGTPPHFQATDLDPGPTPTAQPTTPAPSTTTIPTTTTTYPIVGPSPFLPGTMDPRPAPAGNGNGPDGSCNGTETGPPCGPGVQLHRYYAYTLAERCDQDVLFDGRRWRQELMPTTDGGYEHVWMVESSPSGAGWVGPGAVGMEPAPPGPGPSCPVTNPSIPPVGPAPTS